MECKYGKDKLRKVDEVDETYIGGRAHGTRGRGAANKTPAVTLAERDGEARSAVMRWLERIGAARSLDGRGRLL
jgi:hypothetical protein